VRASLARALSEAVCSEDPHDAIQQLISKNFIEAYTSQDETSSAGAIILHKESNEKARLWCIFNTASMSIAYASSESSKIKTRILRHPSDHDKRKLCLTVLPWS